MCVANILKALGLSTATLVLSACGGGGGANVASIPPAPVVQPPAPTPPRSSDITIFANPTPMEYVVVGTSTKLGETPSSRYGVLSTAEAEQLQIRYSSAGYYEILLPGRSWDTLVSAAGYSPPSETNFQPKGFQNMAGLNLVPAKWAGYKYSEYGNWYARDTGRSGWIAFGIPTPAAGVPTTGTATYAGTVHGSADIMSTDMLSAPSYYPAYLDGKVTLSFDFQRGTLGGNMDLFMVTYRDPIAIGSYNFINTIFSAGSTTYSGRFDTAVSGDNYFLGRFTGPTAQETIGTWAVPFVFSQGDADYPPDNQRHQAIGAWVAKQ